MVPRDGPVAVVGWGTLRGHWPLITVALQCSTARRRRPTSGVHCAVCCAGRKRRRPASSPSTGTVADDTVAQCKGEPRGPRYVYMETSLSASLLWALDGLRRYARQKWGMGSLRTLSSSFE